MYAIGLMYIVHAVTGACHRTSTVQHIIQLQFVLYAQLPYWRGERSEVIKTWVG
jgi:hypothetical protein